MGPGGLLCGSAGEGGVPVGMERPSVLECTSRVLPGVCWFSWEPQVRAAMVCRGALG